MAKKGLDLEKTAKTNMSASVERTNAYANKVKQMFDETVKEILKIKRTLPKIADGEMFSFDAQPPKVQKEVEVLLRRLSSAVTLATEEGIELEWAKANKAVDGIISTVIGKNVLNDENFSGWQNRNKTAMRDFIRRTENAMSLSDRIWQTTRQLREELEVAMTVSIGEGKSAAEMSRDVRQYLNDPDLMFRRFRYKVSEKIVDDFDADGNKIGSHKEIEWGRKWKKKIKDKTGKVKWVDYDKDSYKVGRGVYKSASKNAMRVTRTETNMAYRRADQTRYRQLDFVQGYHIEPVKDHDEDDCEPDICRQLAGDYPKDFIFEGWHPQCRCVCTPILIGQDDAIAMFRAKLHGEDYKKPQQITDYPQGFKDWCKDNADKIKETHKKGKDPYFVRHNMGVVDGILNPKSKKKSPMEIAEERHSMFPPKLNTYIEHTIGGNGVFVSPEHGKVESEDNLMMAHVLANNLRTNVYLLPRIDPLSPNADEKYKTLMPAGYPYKHAGKSPDYYINGDFYEAKKATDIEFTDIEDEQKKKLDNRIRKAKAQADNIVIEIPKWVTTQAMYRATNSYFLRSTHIKSIIFIKEDAALIYKNTHLNKGMG